MGTICLLLWTLLSLVAVTRGYPGGAPNEACAAMRPNHGVRPQNSEPDYEIYLSGFTKYEPEASISVRLKTTGTKGFRGFLLQVRSADNPRQPTIYGTFSLPWWSTWTVKKLKCFNLEDSAVTHYNNYEKNEVQVTWHPPSHNVGDLVFVATIVHDMRTYWEQLLSVRLTYGGETPPPPTPPPPTTTTTPKPTTPSTTPKPTTQRPTTESPSPTTGEALTTTPEVSTLFTTAIQATTEQLQTTTQPTTVTTTQTTVVTTTHPTTVITTQPTTFVPTTVATTTQRPTTFPTTLPQTTTSAVQTTTKRPTEKPCPEPEPEKQTTAAPSTVVMTTTPEPTTTEEDPIVAMRKEYKEMKVLIEDMWGMLADHLKKYNKHDREFMERLAEREKQLRRH